MYPPLRLLGRVLFTIYFRGRIKCDVPPPRRGPAIFVANHNSLLDGVLIHGVIVRPLRVFIAEEWARWWPIRGLTQSLGAIRVTQGRSNTAAFEAALRALETGDAVTLFPEGGIQRDGTLGRFRYGAARLTLATGAPIFPCAIIGSYEALPWPRRFPRPRRITLRCGAPLRFPVRTREDLSPELLTDTTQQIHDAVQALLARGHND